MAHTRTWRVEIDINEHDDERRTHAVARLYSGTPAPLRAEGVARRRPDDREVPEIGDELAVARALADLAHQLLEATAGDIERLTHRPSHLTS
ncbi:DUF1876 domain-containing protein [Actinoplanes sp. NPDC049599]|jgi:hypothetical protein|uniref:DUF1876 domain-containing protein n=1 Tax=Actinoplanes sp. NPDC049599 TaxID=3363903 RepID=UPI00378F8886